MSDPTAYGPTASVATTRFQAIYDKSYHSIEYANSTGSDIAAGQIVVVGTIPMIAVQGIANNKSGTLTFVGGLEIDKDSSTFTQGDAVYWDTNGSSVSGTALAGAATSTASGNDLIGFAAASAATGVARVKLQMTAAKRTTAIAGNVTALDISAEDASLGIFGLADAQGGAIPIIGGTSSTAGNAGGAVSITGGTGGATGNGGAASVVGGTPGATSGTGGAVALTGGGSAAGTNYTGGAAAVTGGAGKGSGSGGAAGLVGGVSGATGTGGAIAVTGGASVGASGTAGSVTVDAGAATGGTAGAVSIGATNASAITIGAASKAVITPGPATCAPGASTAAAGSTYADAGALPAGTSRVYPTTAANDNKGVIVDVADKVTGRMLFIGNGVSNKILKVYGPSGAAINGAAGDAAFSSDSGKGVIMVCLSSSGNTWLAW